MRRIISYVLAILLICSLFCSCNSSRIKNSESKAGNNKIDTIIFTDSCKREVEIPKKITKIVSSGANAERVLYPICSDLLIGLADKIPEDRAKYFDSNYVNLPVLGQFYSSKGTFNLEELVALSPDVIIDIGENKKSVRDDMDNIQSQTGIPTIFIEANINSYSKAYQTLGKILDREDKAKKLITYIDRVLKLASDNKEKINKKVSTLYTTGADGLSANAKGSIQADVLEIVGAENPLEVKEVSNKSGGNIIDMEQLNVMNPEVIIFDNLGGYELSKNDSQWQLLDAVKNNRTYEVPCLPYNLLGNPPSVNQILGILWLGNLIYPDIYKIDIVYEMKEYYRLFYHYELSDDEAYQLLSKSTFLYN